jgi:hypothetical protein
MNSPHIGDITYCRYAVFPHAEWQIRIKEQDYGGVLSTEQDPTSGSRRPSMTWGFDILVLHYLRRPSNSPTSASSFNNHYP